MTEKEKIEMDIADMIIERPYGFRLDSRQFYLYPVTLGKTYLLARLVSELGINEDFVKLNPYAESLRLCSEKKDIVCRLITYHTLNKKEDLFDTRKVSSRQKFFLKNLSLDDMAQLLIILLTKTDINIYLTHFGIDKEQARLKKALAAKDKSSSLSFGGKCAYGNLFSPLLEKYGWSFEYLIWGISYDNLKMLSADAVTSIYLSKEEMRKANLSNEETINADDPSNIDKIMSMDWS